VSDYERIEKVIRYLEVHYREQPSLRALAHVAEINESHFHRLFSRWAGITPKAFLKFLTVKHAKALLRGSASVLDASLDSGLSGPGRLHDLIVSIDAVSQGEFKNRGRGLEIRYGFHPTPFGTALLGVTGRGLCHMSFLAGDRRSRRAAALEELKSDWPRAILRPDSRATGELATKIFGGSSNRGARIAVLLVGTPFRIKVWEALLKIPFGRVVSYGDIARSIKAPRSSRAVGAAVGANQVAYLIPCHRVIREGGIVGEYRWGRARKVAMLVWERATGTVTDW
jgi:AraC family transcriptional regulator of adaptative response/methylated-DNA-[protein]-cysteine methyltransferase